jgi:hypothetical protein
MNNDSNNPLTEKIEQSAMKLVKGLRKSVFASKNVQNKSNINNPLTRQFQVERVNILLT